MVSVLIKKSKAKGKKLTAIFYEGDKKIKTTNFGSEGNKDFTIYSKTSSYKANIEKQKYLARHRVREDWNDFKSAGALSRWILWDKPTREASIKSYAKKFNLTLL
jgi:hypothetical protein